MSAWVIAVWVLAAPASVIHDGDYRFCHEDRYPLHEEERRWCDLAGEKNEACPSLPAACKAKVMAEAPKKGDGESGLRIEPPSGDDRKARRDRQELPMSLSPVALVVLIGLVIGPLVYLLLQWWRGRDDEEMVEEVAATPAARPEEPVPVMGVVETDVERLLSMARQAATAGDHGRAIELAYAAALRRLDRDGHIDLHRGKTNGDYLRALRRSPALRAPLKEVVREVEVVQFGEREPTSGRFQTVLGNVMAIVQGAATLALVLLGLGCSALPSGAGDDLGGDSSPSGTRALLAHLRDQDVEASYRLRPLAEVSEEVGALVILPGAGPRDGDWSPILAWVERGGTLVLAGARPSDSRLALVGDSEPSGLSRLYDSGFWTPDDLELLTLRVPPGDDLVPWIGDEIAQPVLWRYDDEDAYDDEKSYYAIGRATGDGLVMAFASDALFLNIASAVDDNGPGLARLIAPATGRIEICTSWTGTGSQNPAEAIHEARLTPFVGQLLVFCLLLLLFKGMAFGRLRDPEVRTRRAFIDHVRALGLQYGRAQVADHAFRLYAGWALEQLERRMGRGRRRHLEDHVPELAARSGIAEEQVAEVIGQARRACAREPDVVPRDRALDPLRRLAALIDATAPKRVTPRGR